jgi:hypothetical protein
MLFKKDGFFFVSCQLLIAGCYYLAMDLDIIAVLAIREHRTSSDLRDGNIG